MMNAAPDAEKVVYVVLNPELENVLDLIVKFRFKNFLDREVQDWSFKIECVTPRPINRLGRILGSRYQLQSLRLRRRGPDRKTRGGVVDEYPRFMLLHDAEKNW